MKEILHVHLIHNNTAGEGHAKEDMTELIQSNGYDCHYASAKEMGWDHWPENTELIAIAGGDGTVRQVITKLMELHKPIPFALLPAGTANNVSKTLGLIDEKEKLVKGWHNGRYQKIDVGKINRHDEGKFFIESAGFGIFPEFMEATKKVKLSEGHTPAENLRNALLAFQQIVSTCEAQTCRLMIDGKDYSDNYLLVEIMNIKDIGPNIRLSANSDPTDGILEVVLVKEPEREKLSEYIAHKINGVEHDCMLPIIKAQKIAMLWPRSIAHIDDTLIGLVPEQQVIVEIVPDALEHLEPGRGSSSL